MDNGEGRFVRADNLEELVELAKKYPKAKGIFEIGDELEIRGSRFRVKSIWLNEIRLKLLPAK